MDDFLDEIGSELGATMQLQSSFWSGHTRLRLWRFLNVCKQFQIKPYGMCCRCWINLKVVADQCSYNLREKDAEKERRERGAEKEPEGKRRRKEQQDYFHSHLLKCKKTQWRYSSSSQLHKTASERSCQTMFHTKCSALLSCWAAAQFSVTNCSLVKEIGHFNVQRPGSRGRKA